MASEALRPELAGAKVTEATIARSREGARALSSLPSLSGLVTLTLVALVLVSVSIPRLRGFALRENELDAIQTARLFAEVLPAELSTSAAAPAIEALAAESGLARQLADAEFLAEGRLMRRHGYLFEIARVPVASASPEAAPIPELLVRAWPWEPGKTGVAAFVGRTSGQVLGHANGGRWSAMAGPPEDVSGAWRLLR